jgi:uncharacterized protein YtpQ (UPF0354 family)
MSRSRRNEPQGKGVVTRFLIVFAAMISLMGPAVAATLTPRAFTDAFAAAATVKMPSAKVTVKGDLEVETRSESGEATTSDLHNAYAVYQRDPARLDAVIAAYVGVLADTMRLSGPKPAVDRTHIVPVLKPQAWLDGLRNGRAPQPLTERFNDELAVVYAEDLPTSVRFLTERDDIGDRAKLHDLALKNLAQLLPPLKMERGTDGLWLANAGDTYEASLLLLDELWSNGQIRDKVDGDIVVAVPVKDVLLVTGSHNRVGLGQLRKITARLAAGPYALTSSLYVYRDGKFIKFEEK